MQSSKPTYSQQSFIDSIRKYTRAHPLATLLIIAAFLRLLAVIFAKGFMASDDHFVVIRPAWDWLNGIPTWFSDDTPVARGVIYQYSIFVMMWVLKLFGITDPEVVMYVNRFLHAVFSLSIVWMVYRGLKFFADDRAAWYGGLLNSIYFLIPFFAVRNLVEVMAQPFLLGGLLLLEYEVRERKKAQYAFYAGILLGIAFMIRIQTAVCPAMVFVVLIVMRRWVHLLWFSAGGLLMVLLQGTIDYLSFGMFLSSVLYSLGYQAEIVHSFVTNPWYTYILLLLGAFIPPFSFLIFPWIAKTAKRLPILFYSTLFFFAVHSFIPQKQERFILPIFPLLIFLLAAGWAYSSWRDKKWVRGLWKYVIVMNIILLPLGIFNYSQKARVAPLVSLAHSENVGEVIAVTIENPIWLPHFYAQKPRSEFFYVFKQNDFDKLETKLKDMDTTNSIEYTHAIIFSHKNPEQYKQRLEGMVGSLELQKHIGPSLADWILHKLNPKFNHSKESWIYRVNRNRE
ncbi:glycosyltransferase family 39 protein [bacterium]|nr:glycosyltransferase family 39 protein [bacterium]